jgi:hypothetical protein
MGADMTLDIPENLAAWFADRINLAVVGNAIPPRGINQRRCR